MAISDNYTPDKGLGNGSTTVFTGSWSPIAESYMRVHLEDVATGVQTLQSNPADYTLTFTSSGYVVTMNTAPSSDYAVVRSRSVGIDQSAPYKTSRGFQGNAQENSYDKLTAIAQDLSDVGERSFKFQVGTTYTPSLVGVVPTDGFGVVWDGATGKLRNTTASLSTLEGSAVIVSDNIADVIIVADNIADVNSVASDAADIGAVAGSISSVNTVATNIASVNTVAGISGDVTTVANNDADVSTCADNIAAIVDAPNQATAAAASAAAAAAAAAAGLYDDVISYAFADSPVAPTISQEGDLFKIDTTAGAVVVNLDTLASYGQDMKFAFVRDAGANSITINRGGTDTINGGTSLVLNADYETHVLVGDSATGAWIDNVQSAAIADNTITFAKIQDISTMTVVGRTSAGSGDPESVQILDQDGLGSDSDTALATQQSIKAYVDNAGALKANLASPTLTGTPAAPTATAGTNTTQLATTAFVTTAVAATPVPTQASSAEVKAESAVTKYVSPDRIQDSPMVPIVWAGISSNGTTVLRQNGKISVTPSIPFGAQTRITWSTAFADTNYVVILSPNEGGVGVEYPYIAAKTTSYIDVDFSGSTREPFSLMVFNN